MTQTLNHDISRENPWWLRLMGATHDRADAIFQTLERAAVGQWHQLAVFIPVLLSFGILLWFAYGKAALWPLLAAGFAATALAFRLPKESAWRRLCVTGFALILAGFLLISWRANSAEADRLDAPWSGRLYARVLDVDARKALDKEYLYLDTEGQQDLPPKIRVSRALGAATPNVDVGDVVIVRVRLMPPPGPAIPGAYDFAQRAFFDQIGATGSVIGSVRVVSKTPTRANPHWLRDPLSRHVRSRIDGDEGAIAATLASGDRGPISAQADEWMRLSGMAHLLSISGLHVTALVGAVYLLIARSLALFPFVALRVSVGAVAAAGGACAAIFYTWLSGSEVPTIRSCIAALCVLLAMALGRDPLSMRMLAVGATIILAIWPEVVVGPSFQLSFAAVASIIALHDSAPMRSLRERASQRGFWYRFGVGAFSLFLTSLLIEIILSVIALYHFHETGLYGALANMIAIPLTTFVIMPTVALALALDSVGWGGPIWWVADVALTLLLDIAEWAATAPGASLLMPAYSKWGYAGFAIGLCAVLLLHGRLRWLGGVPISVGLIAMIASPVPDILIDASGRHLAIRDANGRAYFLRSGQGDFVSEMMQEQMSHHGDFLPIEASPDAQCNPHVCLITAKNGETRTPVSIMVTRTNRYLDYPALINACSAADIVVSERALPKACVPNWMKLDRLALRQSGGVAIFLRNQSIRAVADDQSHLPWSEYYAGNAGASALSRFPE